VSSRHLHTAATSACRAYHRPMAIATGVQATTVSDPDDGLPDFKPG
jgi:hypothetical protein